MCDYRGGLSTWNAVQKRSFDIVLSLVLLLATSWLITLGWLAATVDTRLSGFFVQERIGRRGVRFRVVKLRTMRPILGITTTVTTSADRRITKVGAFLRRSKIDELPQLLNVLVGDMSFVGPRPDVPGFADTLQGDDRVILEVRPGITGPATLRFRDEERLLALQSDPHRYNREVIWPEKVRLNRQYVEDYRFLTDLRCIWKTASGGAS